MVLRIFTAYREDKRSIKIKMPAKFHGQAITFTLALKNQSAPEMSLTASEFYSEGDNYIYCLKTEQELDFEQHYLVYDNDRNAAYLQWGAIVRTPEFDDHFYYSGDDLGPSYSAAQTQFKLWAPISEQVMVIVNDQPSPMKRLPKGVWQAEIAGELDGQPYFYLHLINGSWQEVQDPYALSAQINSGHSFVIDPEKITNRSSYRNPHIINEAVIYEMSVRDFSSQADIPFQHAKQYLGLAESPIHAGRSLGLDYIKYLGVTHIQLLPVYDFASVDESQIDAVYNWGYDPMLYNVPEGSFAADPYDPYSRILELQKAVSTYHQAGIGVIMDVVYNHVYDVDRFVFEKIVPSYCSRFNLDGSRTNGTGCGNDMASERKMIRKFIVDSVLIWVKYYGFDGFRFDLMGILDIETMQAIEKATQAVYPNIYLYGEGWQMGTGLDSRFLAHQFNSYQLPEIGFFNDRFRDELKKIICHPQHLTSQHKQRVIEELILGSAGAVECDGRYLSPSQSVNYLECHDNATFFDYLSIHHPGLNLSDKKKRASLGLQLILLSQGVAFIHSGQEAFRTKNLQENTYNQPDSINRLDWLRIIEHWDHVDFIRQMIKFRKKHSVFGLLNSQEMRKKVEFYWLNDSVLKYSLTDKGLALEILINFSEANYTFTNTRWLDVHVQAGQISLDKPLFRSPDKIVVSPMSLTILMRTTPDTIQLPLLDNSWSSHL